MVPTATDKMTSIGRKRERGNRSFVTSQLVEQLSCLNRPHMDIEGIRRSSANHLTAGVDRERRERQSRRCSKGPEVTVANEIPCSHRAIQRGRIQNVSFLGKLARGHSAGVLCESHDTKAGLDIPHLDLSIVGSSDDFRAIRRVSQSIH